MSESLTERAWKIKKKKIQKNHKKFDFWEGISPSKVLGDFLGFLVTFGRQVQVVLEAPLALLGLVRGLGLAPLWGGLGGPKISLGPPETGQGPQK